MNGAFVMQYSNDPERPATDSVPDPPVPVLTPAQQAAFELLGNRRAAPVPDPGFPARMAQLASDLRGQPPEPAELLPPASYQKPKRGRPRSKPVTAEEITQAYTRAMGRPPGGSYGDQPAAVRPVRAAPERRPPSWLPAREPGGGPVRQRQQPDRYGVREWLDDFTRPDAKGTANDDLYRAYADLRRKRGREAADLETWGRVMTQSGWKSRRRRNKGALEWFRELRVAWRSG